MADGFRVKPPARPLKRRPVVFWTHDRDAHVRALVEAGCSTDDLVAALSTPERPVTAKAVGTRLRLLGLRLQRSDPFWTTERNVLLRDLWAETPRLTLKAIALTLGGDISEPAISKQATFLGLPSRWRAVEQRHEHLRETAPEKLPVRQRAAVSARALAVRSPIEGGKLHFALTTPKPRPRSAAPETPCPFYHPMEMEGPCHVMVDRRPDRHGVKPGPYCDKHKARVLPISRGVFMGLGTPATYARGHRYS